MSGIIDFYQYKYSRNNYYLNLVFSKNKIIDIKKAIDESFEDLFINNEYKCAYQKLQNLFEEALEKEQGGYVELRINKCYLKYIKNLYFSYYNMPESYAIKELIVYMQFLTENEVDNITKFTTLNEQTKINILLYI